MMIDCWTNKDVQDAISVWGAIQRALPNTNMKMGPDDLSVPVTDGYTVQHTGNLCRVKITGEAVEPRVGSGNALNSLLVLNLTCIQA